MAFVIAFYLAFAVLAALALWRAALPERLAVALFAAAALLSYLSLPTIRADAPQVLIRLLLIDLAVLAGLVALAIRHGRRWCIIAAAFQIVSTLAHFGRVIDPAMDLDVYAIMESASSIPQLVLLAAAIWRHPRRPRRSLPES
ncbi:hypothetical protein [Sphingomonas sp. TZW2008]|uniref:hypothetical protein n=1 Tax=Sphingomonas sp. TZW2008 TaxID=1917973 RepID=UPI00211A30FB|nr:hypothetical protein [Sphingomonas sp. TZW2008]